MDSGPASAPVETTQVFLQDVAYGGGQFVAVANVGVVDSLSSAIYTSSDGDSWERTMTDPTMLVRGVAYGNGVFVVVAGDTNFSPSASTQSFVLRSTDGRTFESTPYPSGVDLAPQLAFGNGIFMIVDQQGGTLASADGRDFVRHDAPLQSSNGVAFGAGHFASLAGGGLYVSEKGDDWQLRDVTGNTNYSVTRVRGVGDTLVVESFEDCCFGEELGLHHYGRAVSRDATTWDFVDVGLNALPAPEFVTATGCVSYDLTTFDTPSGQNTPCLALSATSPANQLESATGRASGGGTYVVVGYGGIATSHDAKTWSLVNAASLLR